MPNTVLSSASAGITITRPNDATAYGAGDVLGAATGSSAAVVFNFPAPYAGSAEFLITSALFEIDDTALKASEAGYNLQLYSVTPPSALGDNAVWDVPSGDRASYLGPLALGTIVDIGSTLYVATDNLAKQITIPASGQLFAYLQTVAGYTPSANRVYAVTLHGRYV